jgi:hypothetical protein
MDRSLCPQKGEDYCSQHEQCVRPVCAAKKRVNSVPLLNNAKKYQLHLKR